MGSAPWKFVAVGVRYCVAHDGIANEDDGTCDFYDPQRDDLPRTCDFRQLYRKERRRG